ncbi:MAG TPA: methylated-DNA--[protein]-cysteine S-methyltransferase [Gemmatales bacterium]|nr:methylated-DNA--[protein]-cysteine S-methyltransferase [Gemmatales bacterium]
MPTLQQPKPSSRPHSQAFDPIIFTDLFYSAMEEIEAMHDRNETVDAVRVDWMASEVGPLLIGVHERHVRLLQFLEQDQFIQQLMSIQKQLGRPIRLGNHRILEQCIEELTEYFAGVRDTFEVPLKPVGTQFQQKVWEGLLHIPYGHTWSYEQLANHIGQPTASRAVGLANGANPIAIMIPCHRVIQKSGQLGGYGGGLWRKQRLLDLEQRRANK